MELAEFERVYPERFATSYDHWRPIVAGTVAKFLRCGDLQEGFSASSAAPASTSSSSPSPVINAASAPHRAPRQSSLPFRPASATLRAQSI